MKKKQDNRLNTGTKSGWIAIQPYVFLFSPSILRTPYVAFVPAVCCNHCMIGAVVSVGMPHNLFSCVFRSMLLATSGSLGSSGMLRVT